MNAVDLPDPGTPVRKNLQLLISDPSSTLDLLHT
jgi:hypothetical protein